MVSILTVLLAGLFSSPDEPQLTFQGWATSAPDNFYATAVQELAGTSESASYGPPYNTAADGVAVGPLAPQQWFGVTHPVDAANDFVITPLRPSPSRGRHRRAGGLGRRDRRAADRLGDRLRHRADRRRRRPDARSPTVDYGPVPVLAQGLTEMASAGALDGILISQGGFYQTDFTKQVLFLGDGSYLDDAATAANLQGNTWGMMNETGSYPGQAWLWLYSFWYQIPQFNSDNPDDYLTSHADAIIFYVMACCRSGWCCCPSSPALRSIPRWIPVHRLIWRDYYRTQAKSDPRRPEEDESIVRQL